MVHNLSHHSLLHVHILSILSSEAQDRPDQHDHKDGQGGRPHRTQRSRHRRARPGHGVDPDGRGGGHHRQHHHRQRALHDPLPRRERHTEELPALQADRHQYPRQGRGVCRAGLPGPTQRPNGTAGSVRRHKGQLQAQLAAARGRRRHADQRVPGGEDGQGDGEVGGGVSHPARHHQLPGEGAAGGPRVSIPGEGHQ